MNPGPAPLIGVTGEDKRLPLAWWFIRWALYRAGARACRLTPLRPHARRPLDGLIVSGGADIDAGLYLPEGSETAPLSPERDAFEIRMLEQALETDMPVLGICRGAQLLNVVLGGSLHPDLRRIRRYTSNRRTTLARKKLLVEPGSQLHGLLGVEQARINSLHHQAINDLGQGLQVSGRDLDGIVQAVETPAHAFRIGLQWHPEYLPLRPQQFALFRGFCQVAAARLH